MKKTILLTTDQLNDLKKSLMFLYVAELKELATSFSLADKGNKMILIKRILQFLETGESLTAQKFPKESYAAKGVEYPIAKNTVMLKGAYKNDLKTRLFFKQLIGDHFHFTAFGIDWLNERWMEGKPPTYQEFAEMWKNEYLRRQNTQVAPKEEWAYINFVQNFLQINPTASRELMNSTWENERQKHKMNIKAKCLG